MHAVTIDVWSDYVCPFCYLVEPALARLEAEERGTLHVTWRAFELRPEPVPTLDPKGDYLREVWSRSVYPLAEQRAMKLTLPPVQPRSRLAHEAAAHAASKGRREMPRALFRAFFEHGIDIGRTDELTKIAAGLGLDAADLAAAFASGRHRAQVLDDEQLAQSFGLTGVPAIVIRLADAPWEQASLVSGAQPYEVLRDAVVQVRERAT